MIKILIYQYHNRFGQIDLKIFSLVSSFWNYFHTRGMLHAIYEGLDIHSTAKPFSLKARVIALSTIAKMPFSTCLHLDKAGNGSSMLRELQHAIPIVK